MKSIGILKTVYNQRHLVDRIASNINDYASSYLRTYIQDDCSDDETFEKYLAASPAHTKVWQTDHNVGARANISSLLQKCDTDYLTFSAGDDFICTETALNLLDFIQSNDSDIFIVKAVLVSDEQAYPLSRERNISKRFSPQYCRNSKLFDIKWKNSTEILVAAATNPGLIWSQGLLVKTSLAKRAGFPPGGEVDDWGFQHNLALISLTETLNITFIDCILGILSIQPNSMGSEALRQLERQVNVVKNHWDPRFQKIALINCLNKKLEQFKDDKFSFNDVMGGFVSAFDERM